MSDLIDARDTVKTSEQMIEELQEREGRFRLLFENAPLGYQSLDENGCFIEVNQAWLDTLGYACEEVIGKSFSDFLHPDWKDHFKENFLRFKAVGAVLGVEFEMVKKDGSYILVSFNGKIGKDEKGRFRQTHCILYDITDQNQAAQKLIESENRFRTMADGLPLIVWVHDHEGKQQFVNKTFLEFFGVTQEDVKKDSWQILVHPDDADAYANEFFACVRNQRPFHGQTRVNRFDGEWRWMESWSRPRFSSIGEYLGHVGTSADITDRKTAEEALKDLTKNLELRIKERIAFAEERTRQLQQLALELSNAEDIERKRLAMILHDDLQQQLGALRFNLFTLLPEDSITAETKERLLQFEGLIDQAIKKTRSLSHELSPPVLHQSGFLAALNWLIKDVQEKHGQQVTLKSMSEAEPESSAVASILYRSARELLFNALKHSGTKTAFIEADVEGDFIKFSVKDHGKGCDVEMIKARTNDAPGFGLFNIKERINFLGGQFEIDSIPGNGCCVALRVPKKPEGTLQPTDIPAQVILKKKKQHQTHPTDQLRIMLVDDHASMRQGLSMLLRSNHDFELVAEASDGIEAVKMAQDFSPDIILMDVSMPEMDGIEATAIIKKNQPYIRIIGLSMHEDENTKQRMIAAGASAYISKVARVNKIIEVIRNERI